MSEFSGKDLYEIQVTLTGSDPPVWRRLIVPKTTTLDKLHDAIQKAMGWSSCHPYSFSKGTSWYQEMPENLDEITSNMKECRGVELQTLLCKDGEQMNYMYGMGDGWQHKILLQKSSYPDQLAVPQIPMCIAGEETCPAENSGGIYGYYQRLKDVEDANNPEREKLRDWLEKDIDSRECNLEAINKRLARLATIFKKYLSVEERDITSGKN